MNGIRPDVERTQRRSIVNAGMSTFVPYKMTNFCPAEQLSSSLKESAHGICYSYSRTEAIYSG